MVDTIRRISKSEVLGWDRYFYNGSENYVAKYALIHRNQLRDTYLDRFKRSSEKKRREGFEDILPHIDEIRFLHPHPVTYVEIAKAVRKVRRIGWRQALWMATIREADLSDEFVWRWAFNAMSGYSYYHGSKDYTWNPELPILLPPGIELGTPTDRERLEFHPDTTVWDVQDAAMYELEYNMGGMANVMLHNYLPNKDKLLKARSIVETYLMINMQLLPDDPWDPNLWGHDARLKSVTIRDTDSSIIELTPDFDSDILEYTVNAPLSGSSVFYEAVDTFASIGSEYVDDSIVITVTAKDGKTTRKYTISIAE